jgi:hypothetical protein
LSSLEFAPGEAMKYIRIGYVDEQVWGAMSEGEVNALIDECFTYDDVLRKNGHFLGGEANHERIRR